jgi:hypothetical protein
MTKIRLMCLIDREDLKCTIKQLEYISALMIQLNKRAEYLKHIQPNSISEAIIHLSKKEASKMIDCLKSGKEYEYKGFKYKN